MLAFPNLSPACHRHEFNPWRTFKVFVWWWGCWANGIGFLLMVENVSNISVCETNPMESSNALCNSANCSLGMEGRICHFWRSKTAQAVWFCLGALLWQEFVDSAAAQDTNFLSATFSKDRNILNYSIVTGSNLLWHTIATLSIHARKLWYPNRSKQHYIDWKANQTYLKLCQLFSKIAV